MVISIASQMNSTFAILQRELLGLVNLGDGALKFSADDIKLFLLLGNLPSRAVESTFLRLANRDVLPIPSELGQDDRRELDSIIFEAMHLSKGERDAVYEAVASLIEARLKKATSLYKGLG